MGSGVLGGSWVVIVGGVISRVAIVTTVLGLSNMQNPGAKTTNTHPLNLRFRILFHVQFAARVFVVDYRTPRKHFSILHRENPY